MNQSFFVVELAHSLHGRVKSIQISYKTLYFGLGIFGIFALLAFFLLSSYLRMTWKVSHYGELRSNLEQLRERYDELQKVSRQRTDQLATLQNLASEVSVAYGFDQPARVLDSEEVPFANALKPTGEETIETYNFLRSSNLSGIDQRYPHQWQVNTQPSIWPINGTLRSAYGERTDPFSGEGGFHKGVDLAAPRQTAVHVTADGVVARAEWDGTYGKLIVVDHGNGLQTYYAHVSQFLVVQGLDVRRGQTIAVSGGTSRTKGSILHYEVRMGGVPVNPYKYLAKSALSLPTKTAHDDLGL